ncbi:MAG: M42 family metallopeptidase [Eubacteriales bacterium]|nr:M42 family metallopeptidase [Eubacteriales bacterium]MDD4079368.1 M42 family metallopeptidase [Eubacteriales bacterium]MDD4769287.1 M42 family metallopeptidase [Eubacteriales bacterium]
MEKYWSYMLQTLEELLAIPSPSGYTYQANGYLSQQLDELGISYATTAKGAIVAAVPGVDNENQRIISAHVDTLGGMVKEIKSNGMLKLTNIGGLGWANVEGENCTVITSSGKEYTGTLLLNKASAHVHGAETATSERKADTMQVRLDEKVSCKEDTRNLGIEVGDFVAFDPRTRVTPSGFIKSRHLDDKAGVAVILGILKTIQDQKIQLPCTTHFFFSNFEEVGHGASAGIPAGVKEMLCIDMGAPGEGQQSDEFSVSICAKDSSGPYSWSMKERLVKLCKDNDIPCQVDIYPFYGSDASASLRAGHDIVAGLIGPGVDASHSYERTHKDSIIATANLAFAYVQSEF